MRIVDIALSIVALPVLLACAYLALLTILSKRARPHRLPMPPHLRFDVVVPAHDEAADIGSTIASLLSVDYPRELYRVVVVADNCTDTTAERAREAGARVMVRSDRTRIGKGHALAFAFEELVAGHADAIVVVDADTVVSPNLLRAFSDRIDSGAVAVQANYAVRNAMKTWRTRAVAIAFAMFHEVRSIGRERLGLSCGLRGNGMCFATGLLATIPYDAFSIVEDVEYGIKLGLAGRRVRYAREACVYGQVASTERDARTQRARWEGGRSRLARTFVPRLLAHALRARDAVCLDLALDLLVPPIAVLFAATTLGVVASLALSMLAGHALIALWLWSACALALLAHGLRGWQLSGTGVRGLLDIVHVPGFVAWKLALRFGRSWGIEEWVRSPRERNAP